MKSLKWFIRSFRLVRDIRNFEKWQKDFNKNWVTHVFVVSRKDTGRVLVTKFFLPEDMKKEACKRIFKDIIRLVKK